MTADFNRGWAEQQWELWNLQALDPDADLTSLQVLRKQRNQFQEFENKALAALVRHQYEPLLPGRNLFRKHPELAHGLIVTMHIGPSQFLPEPLLYTGIGGTILLNHQAEKKLRPEAEKLSSLLCHRGKLDWVSVESPGFIRRLIRNLTNGQPVIVFLDGNTGVGGIKATRERGVDYQLPGRQIRVRGGLGR